MPTTLHVLSIGSNVDPRRNVATALEALLSRFGTVHLSRIAETPAQAVDIPRSFLNLAVAIPAVLSAAALKDWCNAQEESQGRDRRDPNRSRKPRPVDLDFLFSINGDVSPDTRHLPQEPYVRPFVLDLLGFLRQAHGAPEGLPPAVPLSVAGHTVGLHAMTLETTP